MSHEIENNMIAWKGETPWHGLGFEVAPDATGAEMLKVAGLDWKVQRRALAMRQPDSGLVLTKQLEQFKAIVRSDTDHVFNVTSDRYQIVQNNEIVDLFREYCEAGHATMETIGGLRNGATVWALAKLNGSSHDVNGKGDIVNGYVLMATSHDGTIKTIGKSTQVRVVCHNTLSMALRGKAEFGMKHSTKWTPERAEEAKVALGISLEQVQRINEISDNLAKVTLDSKGQIEFVSLLQDGKMLLKDDSASLDAIVEANQVGGGSILDNVIAATDAEAKFNRVGRSILEAILDSPGSNLPSAKNTLWGAVNGVTYYADHVAGRTQDTRLTNAWFGPNQALKADAVNVALQMAGVN